MTVYIYVESIMDSFLDFFLISQWLQGFDRTNLRKKIDNKNNQVAL